MPKRLTALGFAFRRFAVPGRVGARVFGLNIGCRYSTPVRKRPLHPTRSQFKPEALQTQAPVTPATEPEPRAGGSLTTPRPQYQVLRKEPRCPDGTPTELFEVYEIVVVNGVERVHRNGDMAFRTEDDAKAGIKEQSSGPC